MLAAPGMRPGRECRQNRSVWLPVGTALLWLLAASPLPATTAGQIRVATSEGPHYVGFPVTVRITVGGLDEDPEPECSLGPIPDGITAHLAGVNPSVSTSIQILGGRRTVTKTVLHRINYRIYAEREGTYSLGPFDTVVLACGSTPVSKEDR